MIFGGPLLVLGLLLILSALLGAQVERRARGVAAFVLSPLHPATWRSTRAIVQGFFIETVAFSVVVSIFSAGGSLLVVGVGVVVIGLGIEACRLVARIERSRASAPGARPLQPHPYSQYGSGPRGLATAVFLDVNRWRDVVYVFVALPLAILEFAVILGLWILTVSLLSAPFWFGSPSPPFTLTGLPVSPATVAVAAGLVGLLLAPVAASVSQGLMTLHRAVVAGLLCASEQRALERRVETLEESRQTVLDVEASELRGIERDLHDGAQQRLVMLAMDLSLAAERFDSDPAGAKELVEDARDQARLALAELRDLVRGIAPPILTDRGLVPALSAIAGRCSVPTVVQSSLPEGERLPDTLERAAYFVVAEALTNIAKHATARRCEIRCRRDAGSLVVEVWDDGSGGARIIPGGGLAGLAGRIEALDGSLTVTSPTGGPTLVRAKFPAAYGAVATAG